MQKKLLRTATLFLCLVMLFTMTAYGAGNRVSDQIQKAEASMVKKSGGNLSITYTIVTNDVMDKIGVSRIDIQRYTGSRWESEYVFTVGRLASLQTRNANRYTKTLSYMPDDQKGSYRAVVDFEATIGSETYTDRVIAAT